MNDISKRLYDAIESKGMSYGELSRFTGIPKSAIQRYATGETGKIPMDRLEKMASAIGVSSCYLMGWDQNNEVVLSDDEMDIVRRWREATDAQKQKAKFILLDKEEQWLIQNFKKADERDRDLVRAILRRYDDAPESLSSAG